MAIHRPSIITNDIYIAIIIILGRYEVIFVLADRTHTAVYVGWGLFGRKSSDRKGIWSTIFIDKYYIKNANDRNIMYILWSKNIHFVLIIFKKKT